MSSLKAFRKKAGLPDSVTTWNKAAHVVRENAEAAEAGRKAQNDLAIMKAEKAKENGMSDTLTVDWRAVAFNVPSKNMPRSVPWVHGLIENSSGPSPRIELSPKKPKGKKFPVHCIMVAPNQTAAEKMDWNDTLFLTIDGYSIGFQKSMGPTYGWIEGDHWSLVAELDADHPLVVHAAEAAKPKQKAHEKAVVVFDMKALSWSDEHFPHPDFMNEMRAVFRDVYTLSPDVWPGDPLPDFDTVMEQARDRLR